MKKFIYVFNNIDIVNALMSKGHRLVNIRVDLKNPEQYVYTFMPNAADDLQVVIEELGLK